MNSTQFIGNGISATESNNQIIIYDSDFRNATKVFYVRNSISLILISSRISNSSFENPQGKPNGWLLFLLDSKFVVMIDIENISILQILSTNISTSGSLLRASKTEYVQLSSLYITENVHRISISAPAMIDINKSEQVVMNNVIFQSNTLCN